jgi:hypothetical protein
MSDVLDPNASTSAAFNRRAFVGLSAGAAAAISTPTAAVAPATADFGKPHAPIVPPDDPGIRAQYVRLMRPDTTLDAYAAWPKTPAPATPGVIIVHHIWGVDATLRDGVRRYAKAGYVCGDGAADVGSMNPC